jgi:hypothetical protein
VPSAEHRPRQSEDRFVTRERFQTAVAARPENAVQNDRGLLRRLKKFGFRKPGIKSDVLVGA